MKNIEFVKRELKNENYSIVSHAEAIESVYKIPLWGGLLKDGFEVYYLFVPKGSGIKKHICDTYAEKYTIIFPCDENSDIKAIGDTNMLLPQEQDIIVRVCKIAKDYVPLMETFTYSELEEMASKLENEAEEVLNKMPEEVYFPEDIVLYSDESGYRPCILENDARYAALYDFISGKFVTYLNFKGPHKMLTIKRLYDDARISLNKKGYTKSEMIELWEGIKGEVANYRWEENPSGYIYEPRIVVFGDQEGKEKVRISNLFIVKDMNKMPRLCTAGPNHGFIAFEDYLKRDTIDLTLGWREQDEKILRLLDAALALGFNPNSLCTFEEVEALWNVVQEKLKDFTFNDDTKNLWAPYFNNFSYEGASR